MDGEQQDILEGLRNALALLGAFFLLLGAVLTLRDGDDAEVTAKIEAEAHSRKAMRPEACIRQFAAGERYGPGEISTSRTSPLLSCASAARSVPNDVLSLPIQQVKQ